MRFNQLLRHLRPSSKVVRSGKITLRIALRAAEVACDGLPIPGAQAGFTILLALLRTIDRVNRNQEALDELATHVSFFIFHVIAPVRDAFREANGFKQLEVAVALQKLGEYVLNSLI